MICDSCSDEYEETPGMCLVSAGGWCAPSEQTYTLEIAQDICPDCRARMACIAELGFDPGKNGENLRISLGPIEFRDLQ